MEATHHRQIDLPWDREASFTRRLWHDASTNGKPRFHKMDLWHGFHLGIGKAWAAAGLLMVQGFLPGSSIDDRFKELTALFTAFCREHKINKIISKVDKYMCGGGGNNEPVGTWNKAATTTNLCLFLEHFFEQNQQVLGKDQSVDYMEACQMFIALKLFYFFCFSELFFCHFVFWNAPSACVNEFCVPKAHGTAKINAVFRALYAADLWIPRDQGLAIAGDLQQFIRSYGFQAWLHHQKHENKFGMYPKLHLMHEIWANMVHQASLSEYIYNPIAETCSIDEDFVGRAAMLSRQVSPRLNALRSIQRYLAQIYMSWR